jgi:hypothetical protein
MYLDEKIMNFNRSLKFDGELPENISVMNPFEERGIITEIAAQFYRKYYHDTLPRKVILGINPGRLGAGATGIPFTDTVRLNEVCGIPMNNFHSNEPSAVFMYKMIERYGGAEAFYGNYYINSICPLGFLIKNHRGNHINCNYYDDPELLKTSQSFMLQSLKHQMSWGLDNKSVIILGKKNAVHFRKINDEHRIFENIEVLDHPRFIVQYKRKQMNDYMDQYLEKLKD